jgi:hypothetical protein
MNDQIISWIDARIEAILSYPKAFGLSNEAIEMQVLTLLEVRDITLNPNNEENKFGRTNELYKKYIESITNSKITGFYLFKLVEMGELANFKLQLRKAVEFMKGK